jgi:hypothetical protein
MLKESIVSQIQRDRKSKSSLKEIFRAALITGKVCGRAS